MWQLPLFPVQCKLLAAVAAALHSCCVFCCPELGLISYWGMLAHVQGSKIRYGRVPLYTRGDDSNAKQFRSLHAVQRHMVDSGR